MQEFTRRYRQMVRASDLTFAEIARRAGIRDSTAKNPYLGDRGDTFYYTADRVAEALGYVPVVFYTQEGMISRLAVGQIWGSRSENYPGQLIRFHREDRDLSLRELSRKSGIPDENISKYERDIDGPSMQRMWKLGRAMGLEVRYFVKKPETLGERLERLRLRHNITVNGLADRSGLEHNLIQNIVPGSPKTLCLKSLESIAQGFGLVPIVFYRGERQVGDPLEVSYVELTLKTRREELGVTPRELGRWAGVEGNTVVSMENRDHDPYLRSVQRIAGVMGLFPRYLLQRKQSQRIAFPVPKEDSPPVEKKAL